MQKLGLDIGGVIATEPKRMGLPNISREPYPDAFSSIALLRLRYNDVFVISRVDDLAGEQRAMNFLTKHGFWEMTGIEPKNLVFCRKRCEKAPLCEVRGITHFVDNRLEVLSHMSSVTHRFALNPYQDDLDRFEPHIQSVTICDSWKQLYERILATL